jgi:hypothetical protein
MSPTLAADLRVRLRSIPTYDPPYEDDAPPDWRSAGASQPMLSPPLAPRGERLTGDSVPPGVLRQIVRSGRPLPPGPPLPASASPATTTAVVRFVNTCLEILNGYRALGHFRVLAHPEHVTAVLAAMTQAVRRLRRTTAAAATAGRGALIKARQLRTCEPRPGVAEVAVVIGAQAPRPADGEQAWALAFRLERQHDRWLCTAAQLL